MGILKRKKKKNYTYTKKNFSVYWVNLRLRSSKYQNIRIKGGKCKIEQRKCSWLAQLVDLGTVNSSPMVGREIIYLFKNFF